MIFYVSKVLHSDSSIEEEGLFLVTFSTLCPCHSGILTTAISKDTLQLKLDYYNASDYHRRKECENVFS